MAPLQRLMLDNLKIKEIVNIIFKINVNVSKERNDVSFFQKMTNLVLPKFKIKFSMNLDERLKNFGSFLLLIS